MAIRVLYDISVLGVGFFNTTGRTGIYRVVEHVAEGLVRSPEVELFFCATQGLTQRAPGTIRACRNYLASKSEFRHVPFFDKSLPCADVFHSPFHPLPKEINAHARILTVHDLIPLLFPEYMPAANTLLQRLSFSLLKPADHVICNSFATHRDFCRITGIAPGRAHVTHLSADKRIFYPCTDTDQIAAIRQKYGLGQTPYILSLCTLEPRKNIDHVIRAFLQLVREGRGGDCRLVLVGANGWNFGKIYDEIAADPQLAPRVIATGYVPDGELSPLYTGAHAFVYMSFYEGFGLPPLEAMQCGTPVITTNTSSLPEVVAGAGIQLDPTDSVGLCSALQGVICDKDLRQEMSQRGRLVASSFSWEKCVEQTIAVYRKVLSGESRIAQSVELPNIVVDGVIFQLQRGKPFGISRQWLSLLKELAATPLATRIVLLDREGTAPDIFGLRRRRVPHFRLGRAYDEAVLLDRFCREERAGIFLSTYYTFSDATHSLLMLYDMIPERSTTTRPDDPNPEWRDKHHAISGSSSFVAISQSTAREFARYYPQASQRPIRIVPCAASPEFRPHSPEEIAAFKKAKRLFRPYFLIVGRNDAHKNLQLFFHAFGRLQNRQRYAIVMAAGRRQMTPEFVRMVEGADVYAGFFSDNDLSILYSGAIALVYPSRCEGFGLPILEAMQAGCPVIACPSSAIPEVAGTAALYVDEDDVKGMAKALVTVQEPDVRRHLVEQGLNRAQLFSWQKSGAQLAETIQQRLSGYGVTISKTRIQEGEKKELRPYSESASGW